MSAPSKKQPAKKATAAVRARREVRAEKNKVPPLKVHYRGAEFDITRDRLGSARVFMRLQNLQRHPTVQSQVDLLFELLGQRDSARLIDVCAEGDDIQTVCREFMDAVGKAANAPNSSAS